MLSFARWLLARGGSTWSFDCTCKCHVVAGLGGGGDYSKEATNHTKLQA